MFGRMEATVEKGSLRWLQGSIGCMQLHAECIKLRREGRHTCDSGLIMLQRHVKCNLRAM